MEVSFLKTRNEVKNAFIKFKALEENQTKCKIKILRTDNGLEYCGPEFTKQLEEAGIRRERTTAYTPQQNGTAETMNRTLVEMARCLLLQSNLPLSFWTEAIATAAYIRNRSLAKSLNEMTPFEVKIGTKPDVSNFKIFVCKAFALDKTQKEKFQSRSKECIFVGFSSESKAYRLWDGTAKRIIVSRDVRFIEEPERPEITDDQKKNTKFEIILTNPSAESEAKLFELKNTKITWR